MISGWTGRRAASLRAPIFHREVFKRRERSQRIMLLSIVSIVTYTPALRPPALHRAAPLRCPSPIAQVCAPHRSLATSALDMRPSRNATILSAHTAGKRISADNTAPHTHFFSRLRPLAAARLWQDRRRYDVQGDGHGLCFNGSER